MVIYGTKGKEKTIGQGNFYCPRCQVRRPYEHKKISKYFSLYFIPIIPIKNLGEYIECQFCFTPFETSVLDAVSQEANSVMKEFIAHVKGKLEEGIPLQPLISSLLEEGATEETVNTVIALITDGQIKSCDRCNLHYIKSINYCPDCGKSLERIS